MRTSVNLFVSAAVLGVASALPADGNLIPRTLVARGVTLDPSCDRANPFVSGKKYSDKVNTALADAKTMTGEVLSGTVIKGDVTYRKSDAYTKYFLDEQFDQVTKMMGVLNDPNSYTVNILCGSDKDTDTCSKGPIAGTNPNAGSPTMVLCDKFFDPNEDEVKNDLGSKDSSTGRRGWCGTDASGNAANKFPFYSVAGLTILHELTHLDNVGVAGGLSERTVGGTTSHGTIDIYEIGSADDLSHYKNGDSLMLPYQAGRQLKLLWELHNEDNTKYQPIAQTFENAESYAASALQWHFEILCGFSIESDA